MEKPPFRAEEGHRRAPGLCADGLEVASAPASGLLVTGRAKALCARAKAALAGEGPGRAAAAKGGALRYAGRAGAGAPGKAKTGAPGKCGGTQ